MDEGNRKLPAEIAETPPLIPELALPAPRWRSLSALIAVIILLLILAGILIYSHFKYVRLESELNRYEELWNEQEIPNYNYTITYGGGGGMAPVSIAAIQVRDGIPTSTPLTDDYQPNVYYYNAIPKLYNFIRDALEDRPDIIKVTYSPTLGYPMELFVSNRVYTAGYTFSVSDFYIPDSDYLYRESEFNSLETEFTGYESLWNEQEISSYSFVITKSNSSEYWEASIQVRDGIPTSTPITGNNGSFNSDIFYYNTIQKLFQYIYDAIKDWADVIEVTYNPSLGYPVDVYIDPSLTIPDDEFSFSVSDFHVIESGE